MFGQLALECPLPGIGVAEPPLGAVVGALVAAGVGVTVLVWAKLTAPVPSSAASRQRDGGRCSECPLTYVCHVVPPFCWIEASVGRTTRPLSPAHSLRLGRVASFSSSPTPTIGGS